MNELGKVEKQDIGRWANTGWKPATCRSGDERAMLRFDR
jgi:hypothetical protein